MHRTSIFNIKIDLDKSEGAHLYDVNSGRKVLDFFGMYSSLALGYNHPAFDDNFSAAVLKHARTKLPNCEMQSEAADQFLRTFSRYPSMQWFNSFHFTCTGAAAVEAAVKVAMFATGRQLVYTQHGSFHGIYGYSGLLASREGPAKHRVKGFPVGAFRSELITPDLAAVLIEPIQCTRGDVKLLISELIDVSERCKRYGVPLIFDEVQTGVGATGTFWYFEQLGIVPDILVFGKKSVSGVAIGNGLKDITQERPEALEATWDGDVIDMIRTRIVIETIEREELLENVMMREEQLADGIAGLRHVGLLLALDFDSTSQRDEFVRVLWREHATIVIPTGERTVRMRPPLTLNESDANEFIGRVHTARKALGREDLVLRS